MAAVDTLKPVSFLDAYVLLSPASQAWVRELVASLLESEGQASAALLSHKTVILPFAARVGE